MKKVLIGRVDNLGDFILTTPFISALKKAFPDAKIVFIGSTGNLSLASRIDLIDEVILLTHKSIFLNIELIGRLRKEKFDMAVAFHPDTTLASIMGITGAKLRICYWFGNIRPFSAPFFHLCNHRILTGNEHVKEGHMVKHFLLPLQIAGCEMPEQTDLVLPRNPEQEDFVKTFLLINRFEEDKKIIALQLCHKWILDKWEPEDFKTLCKELLSNFQDYRFIVLYHRDHDSILNKFLSIAGELGMFVFCGSLFQWIYMIKMCHLYIGYDSGGIHVAAGWKKPVIDIFIEPSSKEFWSPWNVPHVSLLKNDEIIKNIIDGVNILTENSELV